MKIVSPVVSVRKIPSWKRRVKFKFVKDIPLSFLMLFKYLVSLRIWFQFTKIVSHNRWIDHFPWKYFSSLVRVTYPSFWYSSTEEFNSESCSFSNWRLELTKLNSRATVSLSFRFVVALKRFSAPARRRNSLLISWLSLHLLFCSLPRQVAILGSDPWRREEKRKWVSEFVI